MKIGLIDVDNWSKPSGCFPNLPLMKISAWHKKQGDDVSWYDGSHFDRVYMSKVFSFSPDFPDSIDADHVIRGGSGYAISLASGVEVYEKAADPDLPDEIEHIYPDYSLYGISDTAYGFIQRGCPRGCSFCHVKSMQGTCPKKVADLKEFWRGQKNIILLDPNLTSLPEWRQVFQQLIDSRARVDFSQGLDIRLMTPEKTKMLQQIRLKNVHFAWDDFESSGIIYPKLKEFKDATGWGRQKVTVYVLCNFNTTIQQDLLRVYAIRNLGFNPYIMRYNKEQIKRGSEINALARWVNFPPLFWKYKTFEEYKMKNREAV